MSVVTVDEFWSKVDKTDGCWIYNGRADDYNTVYIGGGKSVGAHVYAYEDAVGPVPDGLHVDHLCMVKGCVRPDHLEPVTIRENARRARAYYELHPKPRVPKPPKSMRNPDLLTAREAADRLKVTPKTLHEWAKAGKVHRITLPGSRSSRFRTAEIDAIANGDAA